MALKPITTRISEELDREIRDVMIFEKADKATAVRKILEIGIDEWRKRYALSLLKEGKVSFNKAAEIAKLTVWDLAELLKQRRAEWVEYTPEELRREFDEALKAGSK
ncbi:MAG: UPF0175 family protein [archaeon]|nr:UPF0175 family protein [archaeon]